MSSMSSFASIFFVDLTFIRCSFMCPLSVSSDSGKCLLTDSTVIPGHVTKFPALMAASHVDLGGNPVAACKYLMAPGIDGRE